MPSYVVMKSLSKDKDGDSRRERKRKEEEVERSLTVFTKSPYGIISRQEVSIDTDKTDLDEEIFRSNTYHLVVTDEDGKDILSVGGNSVVRIDKSTGKVTASGTYTNTTNGYMKLTGFCCKEMYVNPIAKNMGISHGDIFSVKDGLNNILVLDGELSMGSISGRRIKFNHHGYPMSVTISDREGKARLDMLERGEIVFFWGDKIVFKHGRTTFSIFNGHAHIDGAGIQHITTLDGHRIVLKHGSCIKVSVFDGIVHIDHLRTTISLRSSNGITSEIDGYSFPEAKKANINCFPGELRCYYKKGEETYRMSTLRKLVESLKVRRSSVIEELTSGVSSRS